jgi:outer membrane protein assembly factor BamB
MGGHLVLFLAFLISCGSADKIRISYWGNSGVLVVKEKDEKKEIPIGREKSRFYKINVLGDSIYIGFESGKILKIDKKSGKKLWEKSINTFANVEFSFDRDTLYFVGIDNNFYAMSQLTGEIKYIYYNSTETTVLNQTLPMVTDKGIVVVFNDGKIVLFDKKTWKVLWSRMFREKPTVVIKNGFLVVNGKIES